MSTPITSDLESLRKLRDIFKSERHVAFRYGAKGRAICRRLHSIQKIDPPHQQNEYNNMFSFQVFSFDYGKNGQPSK